MKNIGKGNGSNIGSDYLPCVQIVKNTFIIKIVINKCI